MAEGTRRPGGVIGLRKGTLHTCDARHRSPCRDLHRLHDGVIQAERND